jgi:hypothetical protein
LFDSRLAAIAMILFVSYGYLRGPEKFVDRTAKGPWPSALGAVIAIIFASPLIGVFLGLPGSIPEELSLKLFVFIAGEVAIIRLLTSAFEILSWPLFGHRGAWLSRTVSSPAALFHQLVESAVLLGQNQEIEDVLYSIQEAGETARALHQRHEQRLLERGDQEIMKSRGDKIAATIWHHKYLAVMPGYDLRNVSQSLFNGAISIYEDDWDNLCQVDPRVGVKSIVRRYAPRVLVAAIIAAIAVHPAAYRFANW